MNDVGRSPTVAHRVTGQRVPEAEVDDLNTSRVRSGGACAACRRSVPQWPDGRHRAPHGPGVTGTPDRSPLVVGAGGLVGFGGLAGAEVGGVYRLFGWARRAGPGLPGGASPDLASFSFCWMRYVADQVPGADEEERDAEAPVVQVEHRKPVERQHDPEQQPLAEPGTAQGDEGQTEEDEEQRAVDRGGVARPLGSVAADARGWRSRRPAARRPGRSAAPCRRARAAAASSSSTVCGPSSCSLSGRVSALITARVNRSDSVGLSGSPAMRHGTALRTEGSPRRRRRGHGAPRRR